MSIADYEYWDEKRQCWTPEWKACIKMSWARNVSRSMYWQARGKAFHRVYESPLFQLSLFPDLIPEGPVVFHTPPETPVEAP